MRIYVSPDMVNDAAAAISTLSSAAAAAGVDSVTSAAGLAGTVAAGSEGAAAAVATSATVATTATTVTAVTATLPAATASVGMFSDPDSLRYFVAGGTCASVSHAAAVPIDVVKTRLQTSPEKYDSEEGVVGAAQRIIADEGIMMLGQGLGPTVAGYCVQGSLKYGFFEALKPVVRGIFASYGLNVANTDEPWKVLAIVFAAALAEFIGSTALAPFEAARIRMVVNPSFADGITSALKNIEKEEGLSGLFIGLPAILFKQIPYTVVSLTVFEIASGYFYSQLTNFGVEDTQLGSYRFLVTLSAAAIGAVLSCLASQPGDTLLSRVNQSAKLPVPLPVGSISDSATSEPELENFDPVAIMIDSARELGLAGLFRGTRARLLHSTIIVVSQLLIYDTIKQIFGIAASGAH